MDRAQPAVIASRVFRIPIGREFLSGDLSVPVGASGLVVFAHGSGSSRHSPRNQRVATVLQHRGLATVLVDLLTEREEEMDAPTGEYRFDIELLANRLVAIVTWIGGLEETASLPVGLFGASTGAGAALVAAARLHNIAAVVSRGGRPDLAGAALAEVRAPTLLIVGGQDVPVVAMNREALAQMHAPARLEIGPGATHLFEERGALERVATLAADWFERHLTICKRS